MKRMARWFAAGLWAWMPCGAALAGDAPAGQPESARAPAAAAELPSAAAAGARAPATARRKPDVVSGLEHHGRTQEIRGRMWKDGVRVRFEMALPAPGGELIQYATFDGRVFTTYLPAPANMANKIDFSELEKRLDPGKWALFNRARALAVESNPLLGMDLETMAFQRFDALDGFDVHVFEAAMEPIPDDFRGAFPYVAARAELWVAVADGLPRRVVHFADSGAKILAHTFRNVEIDPELDDSLFALKFSAETKVEDSTRKVIQKLVQ